MLHLRNVLENVIERLGSLAERQGMWVSALALQELTEAARRADNPRLLAELPEAGFPTLPSSRA